MSKPEFSTVTTNRKELANVLNESTAKGWKVFNLLADGQLVTVVLVRDKK